MAQRTAPQGCSHERHRCLCRSSVHQVPPIQLHSAAMTRRCVHYFFHPAQVQWPIRVVILSTSDRFLLPVFRPGANLIEQQIWICVVIGCRWPDAGEITHAGSGFRCWIIGNWRLLDGHFEQILSSNWAVAARVHSTNVKKTVNFEVVRFIQ